MMFFYLLTFVLVTEQVQTIIVEETFVMRSVYCAIDSKSSASSILISGVEYSLKQDGINVVVYDIKNSKVVTSKSFLHAKTLSFVQFFRHITPGMLVLGVSQLACNKTNKHSDLNIQKSVIYGLKWLHLDTKEISPITFRSSAFVFCQHSCHHNISSTINFPFHKIHDFKEDPVLVTFTTSVERPNVLKDLVNSSKGLSSSHDHTTLYAIIISCSILVCLTLVTVAWFIVRRKRSEKRNLNTFGRRNKRNMKPDTSCKLLYCSTDKGDGFKQTYKPTASARLFSLYSETNDEESNSAFATYIRVDSVDQIYKVPSGVSKYDPPLYPPRIESLQPRSQSAPSRATPAAAYSSVEYLRPHEYANPEHTTHERCHEEIDTDNDSVEGYMSLEPYDNAEYGEPIYDNI